MPAPPAAAAAVTKGTYDLYGEVKLKEDRHDGE
jgi:hypothetical protein